jgi:hypothetical protein
VSDLRFELGSNSWSGRKRPSPVGISTATPDWLDEWFDHAADDTPPGLIPQFQTHPVSILFRLLSIRSLYTLLVAGIVTRMIFSHGPSVPNNNPCGQSVNRDYVFVLISELAGSKMEYEDALPGGSNIALHCAKATP